MGRGITSDPHLIKVLSHNEIIFIIIIIIIINIKNFYIIKIIINMKKRLPSRNELIRD